MAHYDILFIMILLLLSLARLTLSLRLHDPLIMAGPIQ